MVLRFCTKYWLSVNDADIVHQVLVVNGAEIVYQVVVINDAEIVHQALVISINEGSLPSCNVVRIIILI